MKRILIVALLVIAGAVTSAQQPVNVRIAKPGEVPFVYNADTFSSVKIERVEKAVVQAGDLPTEAPEHSCFHLEDKRPLPALEQGPRYFYPAHSTICIIPLKDTTVADFAKSYPYIHEAAGKLRKLLARRPAKFKFDKELYDLPFNNAAGTVQSKVQYLNFKTGKGIFFLTQYSQDAVPTPVNNEELTCDFQGLSNDGKYYVAARFAITHPSLPKGIDSTKLPPVDQAGTYMKKQEQLLNRLADGTFQPSLTTLKSLIASITTKAGTE